MKKTFMILAPVRLVTLLDDGSSSISEKSLKLILLSLIDTYLTSFCCLYFIIRFRIVGLR